MKIRLKNIKKYIISDKKFINLILIIPYIVFLISPFIVSFYLRRFTNPFNYISNISDRAYKKFLSDDVQNRGYLVNLISFSRRENAAIKINLLEKIDKSKKDLIIYSNHQLKFITRGLKYKSIFNLWTADYSITEISDLISFLDKNMPKAIPNKIILTSITSPNNDMGGAIIGYGTEIPEFIIGYSKNPYARRFSWKNFSKYIFYPGDFFENVNFINQTKYIYDFKFLIGKANSFIPISILKLLPINSKALNLGYIQVSKSPEIECSFSIDKLGSAIGSQGGCNRELIFDQKELGDSFISKKDISEIVYSLSNIDRIAKKRDLLHIVLLPPVYESYKQERLNSIPNKVLSEAIDIFRKNSSNTLVIDHRFDSRFLGLDNKKYYYHYDHPSPEYGEKFFNDLSKTLKSEYGLYLK